VSTVALVEQLAPEVAGDHRVSTFLTLALARVDATAWGTLYTQGVALTAAKMLLAAPVDGGDDFGHADPTAKQVSQTRREKAVKRITAQLDDLAAQLDRGGPFALCV